MQKAEVGIGRRIAAIIAALSGASAGSRRFRPNQSQNLARLPKLLQFVLDLEEKAFQLGPAHRFSVYEAWLTSRRRDVIAPLCTSSGLTECSGFISSCISRRGSKPARIADDLKDGSAHPDHLLRPQRRQRRLVVAEDRRQHRVGVFAGHRDVADAAGVFDILIVAPGTKTSPATASGILTSISRSHRCGSTATCGMVLTGATGISASSKQSSPHGRRCFPTPILRPPSCARRPGRRGGW